MQKFKYTDAYKSIKAPVSLHNKVLNGNSVKRRLNYKALISAAACVIIIASIFPAYVGSTNPSIAISEAAHMTARQINIQIPLKFDLDRSSLIEVSKGTLEGYGGEKIKGEFNLIWSIGTEDTENCTVTVKDAFRTTVYSLSYNENNGSLAIIKN